MVALVVNSLKLLLWMGRGLRGDSDFRILLFLLLALLLGAVPFYMGVEGWSLVDALYFSVMTMSTIGYGDLVPTTPVSKLFTIIYTFMSIGVFASLISKIVAINLARQKHKSDDADDAET